MDAGRSQKGLFLLEGIFKKYKKQPLPLCPPPEQPVMRCFSVPIHNTSPCYLGLLRVTNINTRLMAIRRSFREVIANIAS